MTERPVTVAQAAEFLCCSTDAIYDMVARREIPARKVAGKWLFFLSELAAALRKRDQETAPRARWAQAGGWGVTEARITLPAGWLPPDVTPR